MDDKDLLYKNELIWPDFGQNDRDTAFGLAENYIEFLDNAKTERMAVTEAIKQAESGGFKHISEYSELKPGDKVYYLNRKKNIMLAVIGIKSMETRTHLIAAHIDSPRIDLKSNPVYESENLVLLKTHYYGGIKKYQWVNIPLEMHGVIVKKDGTVIDVHIGNDPKDPVFVISDVLPHIGMKMQSERKTREVIKGEELNVIAGGLQAETEIKEKTKLNFLKLLNQKYDVVEEDFLSAELSMVPAFNARFVGLDKGLVAGYGQDDRICSYTALRAILETNNPTITSVCMLVDKEETGSDGNTGAQSRWWLEVINDMLEKTTGQTSTNAMLYRTMGNLRVLSSDVNAAINPTFPSIHEPMNAGHMGKGVIITKFSGGGGKGGTNDAHAEYLAYLRNLLDENNVAFQLGEWGKVDEGGAGTVAKFLAKYNAEVIDIGTGLIGMHSTYELSHIADLFMTYRSYVAFYNAKD